MDFRQVYYIDCCSVATVVKLIFIQNYCYELKETSGPIEISMGRKQVLFFMGNHVFFCSRSKL